MIHIAVDAMGGSQAPHSNVEACVDMVSNTPDLTIRLYGNETSIQETGIDLPERVELVHCPEHLSETDRIFDAIKADRPVSILEAMKSLSHGENDGLVSAGSTGGVFVSALHLLGAIEGVRRPGGLMHIPTLNPDNPSFVCLDVGLNADVKARDLDEFAVLGSHYAQTVQGKQNPRVALLSNGTEETKGDKIHKKAYQLLSKNPAIHFIGNVEAHGLMDGELDVLVSDGFSGNVYLKQHEEMTESILNHLLQQVQASSFSKDVQNELKEKLLDLKASMTTSQYGACLIAGLKAPVVITHGRSNSQDMLRGMQQLYTAIKENYIAKTKDFFSKSKRY